MAWMTGTSVMTAVRIMLSRVLKAPAGRDVPIRRGRCAGYSCSSQAWMDVWPTIRPSLRSATEVQSTLTPSG